MILWVLNKAPVPHSENERLAALRQFSILGSATDGAFEALDEFAALACQVCQTPIALVSFIDSDKQLNKSKVGWDIDEIPRQESISAHAILSDKLFVVENASSDPRFSDNPFVRGAPGIRFYAAAPLITVDGHPIGTLSVLDQKPRELPPAQGQALLRLAKQIMSHLYLRQRVAELNSKQRRTQAALQISEGFYHSLVETLPQNIFRKDLQGKFTFVNSRFVQTLGKIRSDIIGKTDFDLFPPDLAAKYQTDDQRVIQTGSSIDTIEQHQSKDGSILYVHVVKSALYDLKGQVCGIQGIFWDETERFKAQEALAHERDLLRAMLEYIPDSIYFKDRQSRFIICSKSLAQRLGLRDPSEAIGKTDFDYFSPEHAREAFADEQRILQTGEPLIAKSEREKWTDGREAWVLTTKVPLRTHDGVITGTFGISRDISELKQTEAELALARDAALESARLKSEFLANMSHEIRTPMNAVIGMTGLLLDTELNAEQRSFSETIRQSADALLGIINDILDFSKIEAGKLAIDNIDFDLNEMVEDTIDLLAESAQGKELELVCWIHDDVPKFLRGDPGRLRQILTNLVGNAIKFTEKGEVLVNVTKQSETESKFRICFEVKDSGIGIPPEAQSRIFQAFTQGDGSMTRRYGGTGLGLAICKQITELMHGEIHFESTSGEGSRFWFVVPLGKALGSAAIPRKAGKLGDARILIVDDNATNREILERQITSWRMRATAAGGGLEALEILRDAAKNGDRFDLAVLDMQMPEMDGLTLAKAIKEDPNISSTSLVILTSLGYLPQERAWRAAGISAYLIKPVRESRLFECLSAVLLSGGAPQPIEMPHTITESASPMPIPQSCRILLAEDNPVNQKVALRQLQKLGFIADPAASGLEVLNAIQRIPYDIILMDCQMPEVDGYEATRRIRALERLEGNPGRPKYIIAMTANALQGDREICLSAGMNDYVSKPVRIHELQAALQRGLDLIAQGNRKDIVVDPTILDGLRELRIPGQPDPFVELIDLFLQDTPNCLARVEQSLRTNDFKGVEAGAHGLKGSAANLGAVRMTTLCAQLCRAARESNPQQAAALLQAIMAEFSNVRSILLTEKSK